MTCKIFVSVQRRNSMSDDDDHMSDRDMGAPSPGGMSSIGGGSRPGNQTSRILQGEGTQ